MDAKEVIIRSLEQSQGYLTTALDGLTQEEAAWSPKDECNNIAFIFWHLVRTEDIFLNRIIQRMGELYETEGWQEKLGTPAKESGWQYTAEQLQAWPVPKLEVLREYAGSVREKTLAFLQSVPAEKLTEVVPYGNATESVGGVLSQCGTEIVLHTGQITYLRGVQRGLNQ